MAPKLKENKSDDKKKSQAVSPSRLNVFSESLLVILQSLGQNEIQFKRSGQHSANYILNKRADIDQNLFHQTHSAPSHFYSLVSEEIPICLKPQQKFVKRYILKWDFINESDTIELMNIDAVYDSFLIKNTFNILVKKKFHLISDRERYLLISLLYETYMYGMKCNFDAAKMSSILSIYIEAHAFYRTYFRHGQKAIWDHFQLSILAHAYPNSPFAEEVFEPRECYDIMTHFHGLYISNLPLIHINVFGVYRLKFTYPYKPKE